MAESESTLVVPLRSNASTLITGAPIAAMRRRLKMASLIFDRVLLEAGTLRVFAGPGGASSFVTPPAEDDPPQWQTPMERNRASRAGFRLSLGDEKIPGAPSEVLRTLVESEASIAWNATLEPFADELSSGCDWIDFVTPKQTQGMRQLADDWSHHDQGNPSLKQAIPIRFARNTIIRNANMDLATAAFAGASISIDAMHHQVVAQRFKEDAGWRISGFAVPILLPQVGNLPWEAVVAVRKKPHVARFRVILREVEEEARVATKGGDVEALVHRIFERRLSGLMNPEAGMKNVKNGAGGLILGVGTGIATMGITGIWGAIAGGVLGAATQGGVDTIRYIPKRRSRGWVSVYNALLNLTD